MITRRLRAVSERISKARSRAGLDPKEIELVLVTKDIDLNQMKQAYQLGIRDFGENRVQEFLAKREGLPQDIKWHFIGYLQTNKVKFLVGQVSLIHSCDRLDLARALQKEARKRNQTVEILIQVNTSHEATKHGFDPDRVGEAVCEMESLDCLHVRGLMTVGPHTSHQDEIRNSFRSLRILRDELGRDFPKHDWHYLSMGMSGDFEIAIEEGANLLRIGSAVFGERAIREAT